VVSLRRRPIYHWEFAFLSSGLESGTASELVWNLWRRDKVSALVGN